MTPTWGFSVEEFSLILISMWEVQYRCLYREHWYDYRATETWEEAVQAAQEVVALGRTVRILDPRGVLVARH